MSYDKYFPQDQFDQAAIINLSDETKHFHLLNKDHDGNAFLHFNGHGKHTYTLGPGEIQEGRIHLYSDHRVTVDSAGLRDYPGHMDVHVDGFYYTIVLESVVDFTSGRIRDTIIEPELQCSANYGEKDGHSFGLYYSADGQGPVPKNAMIPTETRYFWIFK